MLLDINKFIEKEELKQITTANLMINNKFDPNGLFSNIVFGLLGSSKWRTEYAFIDLKSYLLHPILHEIADRRCSVLLKLLSGKLSIVDKKLVSNNSGNWGINYFYENTLDCVIVLKNSKLLTSAGDSLCNYIVKHKDKAFINNIIVLPPQFRPIRIENTKIYLHPINDQYRNILNEAHVLSYTNESSKMYNEILFKLQEHVFKAYQILRDMIKGKTGIQRKSLLGKTMDFSARAVIIGDPKMLPNHVGVPFRIALNLFKPFIIYKSTTIYKQQWENLGILKPSILSVGNLITMIQEGKKELLDQKIIDLFLNILNDVCKEKVVILKRDPSLHKLNLRAFYVTIVFSDSLHINPLVTEGFNADFDGDQMAIYLPLTESAQKEAKEKMLMAKNMWGAVGSNLALEFKNDTAYGVYLLTMDPQNKQVEHKCTKYEQLKDLLLTTSDPSILVNFNGNINTIGRHIMEAIVEMPIKKQYKKSDVNKLFVELLEKHKNHEKIMEQMNDLMKIAILVPTLIGKPMDIQQFQLPEHLKKQKENAFKAENPSVELKKVTQATLDALRDTNSIVYDLVNSGGRGSLSNIQTQIVAKGYVEDTDGSVIDKPIKASLNDGLTSTEYVNASIGGRKGIVDRSQMTAISGYLTRQMVYCAASVRASKRVKNCGTKKFFEINVTNGTIADALMHRYLSNGKLITNIDDIINKKILIQSPMYCSSSEMCQTCLGYDVTTRLRASNIGIIAAQILGERGTQLTMRTFHCLHAKTIILYKLNNKILCSSFETLWDKIDSEIVYSGKQEEKLVEKLFVWDKDKYTKVNKIIRHPQQENTEMVMLRTNGGDFIISQDNHPHMVSWDKEENFRQYKIVEAKNLDMCMYFINSTFPIWQQEKLQLTEDAYLLGICLGGDLLNTQAHIPLEFIYYSDEDLSKILCGIIDGSSCFVDPILRCVNVEINSVELIQQIHHILKKFNIEHRIMANTSNQNSEHQTYIMDIYPTEESNINFLKYSDLLKTESFSKINNYEKYDDLITYKQSILYTNEFVYDLETETHTLTANGMWTHNTGGSGAIKSFIVENSKLPDLFIQDGNDIICKAPIQFIFEKEYIRGQDSDEYIIQNFHIKTKNEIIDISLNYNFTILVPNKDLLAIENDVYIITYDINMVCGSMKNSSQGITGAVAEVMKVFNSRMFVNDALALKIHELYSTSTRIPMWAVEIIVSQCARDESKLALPYRLSGMRKEPTRVPMKQVALLENWKRGAAFENVSNAFHQAILSDSEKNMISSDLDNLLDL